MDRHEPNWAPLEALIPDDQRGEWMWMGRVHRDGHVIEQYKHVITRGYLNLDHAGHAWKSRITTHGCSPWCDCPEGQEHVPDVFEHFTVPLDKAIAEALS